jgi:hypothetical protein
MRKVTVRLTLGLLVLGVAAWVVLPNYRSKAKREGDEERQRDKALAMIMVDQKQTRESIARMVSAHNAVTDWTEPFGGDRFADRLTSEDLTSVLTRRDRRPVLVFGSLVDVITQDDGCKLEVDAKANLVSNIRLWLTCTPAQVKEAISHQEEAREEALKEIREEAGEEESAQQKQDDGRQAEQMARQGYAIIAHVDTVDSGEAETIDDPPTKAEFIFAEGRCLELLYVGRDYSLLTGDEKADLRLNTSEDEAHARREMRFLAHIHRLTQKQDKKWNH